jgi:hypothetical protein
VRLFLPLAILRFPLPAILAALVVDAADQTILQQFTTLSLDNYQNYDKALDIHYLSIAYLAVYRNWADPIAIAVARFLWYYRLIGVMLFEIVEERWMLFVFPNTFEFFFIAYCAIQTKWDPRRMSTQAIVGLAAFIWVFVKLPQEWWIHIAQNDFTDFMHETVFGVDAEAPWSEALTNRPAVTLLLALTVVGLIMLVRVVWPRLPEPDWTFGVDMDRTDAPVRRATPATTTFGWALVEKLALVGLISAIFASVLDIGATAPQIVGATVLLVGVDLAVSTWFSRRGSTWSSIGVEFVVLAAANAALIGTYSAVVGDGRLDRGITLFFGLLLTLQLVLFDRYRPVAGDGEPGTSAATSPSEQTRTEP